MFLDNGSNFLGTGNFFETCYTQIANVADAGHLEWTFIPPHAPHFERIWETAVKAVKCRLASVIKDTIPSFEEYCTLAARIEAVLNSQPIAYKENAEQSAEIITPAHFFNRLFVAHFTSTRFCHSVLVLEVGVTSELVKRVLATVVQGVPESTAGPPKVDNYQRKRPPRAVGISKKSKQLSISLANGSYRKNLPR